MKKLDGFRRTITRCAALLAFAAPPAAARPPVEFANTSFIIIHSPRVIQNDGTVAALGATPYPSTISVSAFGANETIAKVTVKLRGLSHANPSDIDILLVGPGGQSILLFSDTCGGIGGGGGVKGDDGDPGTPVTVILDDDSASSLPQDGPLVSGIFKPTNFEVRGIDDEDEAVDVFPEIVDENGFPIGPAPEPSSGTELSLFAGSHPNGDWLLFVVDDDLSSAGSIANGWSLTITTSAPSLPFRRGDANADGSLNITDAVATLAALFLGGSQPECSDAADANDDGALSITDAAYMLSHLFRGGAAPPAPGPEECGEDPTLDELTCDSPTVCPGECPGMDLLWDSRNCGACGNVCPPGTACAWGVCEGLCIDCGF